MWHRLSIRNQLIVLMAVLLTVVELGTLGLVNWFDSKERQTIAIEQAQTLGRSLNNDLLKVLLAPSADSFSDIAFRVSGFKSVDALIVQNEQNDAIFSHGNLNYFNELDGHSLKSQESYFSSQGRLFIKLPIQAEDFVLGQTLIVINPKQFQTRLKEHIYSLLMIFPLLLLLGLIIAWKMSHIFTRPFSALAQAMRRNDVQNQTYQTVKTNAKNEVKSLFDGYNDMINQISDSIELMDYRSRHDSLTGLYNRYGIEQELLKTLKNENQDSLHALINIDLDQFKLINDSVGHSVGDELLKMLAQYLRNDLPDNVSLARVGGDDFFLLFHNTDEKTASQYAHKLIDCLKDFRFFWENNAISVSASLGMVLFKPFEYTLEELIKTTDVAFYTAKSAGRNKLHIYNPDDKKSHQITEDIEIAGFIKEALQDGPARFELFAQDIVPLQYQDDKISYEVLIRMWDSNNQFLPPDAFLSTAERYHMMVDIDIHVLWTYLNTVCKHPEHIKKLHSVHINLAGGTLNNPQFQDKLKQAIKSFNFPWQRLELEITETSAIGNLSQATEFINFCRSKGIGFALDDFGTGMSSFEYLKNLPFNVVKIDGSFVRDMLTDPVDHAMIRYTHDISQLRSQETVAEYVETQADVDELRNIGITYGQGYHLGKPRALSEWLQP
jgi:diguanylate cyclase (GGDEF)-like protein